MWGLWLVNWGPSLSVPGDSLRAGYRHHRPRISPESRPGDEILGHSPGAAAHSALQPRHFSGQFLGRYPTSPLDCRNPHSNVLHFYRISKFNQSTLNSKMDPLSIVGAVSDDSESVFSVSTLLYAFITSATVVDKSLEALQVEVKSLQKMYSMPWKTVLKLLWRPWQKTLDHK